MVCGLEGPGVEFKVRLMSQPNQVNAHASDATIILKGLVHDNAHARRLSLQNKFVGSTLNSKSPLPVQSLKILRFIRTFVALAGLVILR